MNAAVFSGLEQPVDFYVIRHGQSEGNADKILQGRGEYPLSEKGRAQALERGRSLKAIFNGTAPLFYTSPQMRAKETAMIIAAEAGLGEPVLLDVLKEMELGIWTGKNWNQVKNDEPSLWENFRACSWDAIPGAESSAALYDRALQVWAALCANANKYKAEKVVVVTHGGLIQWLLKVTFRCKSWFPLFPITNCGLFKLCAEPASLPKAEPMSLPAVKSAEKGVYLCWEEINSPIPDYANEPRGFPS